MSPDYAHTYVVDLRDNITIHTLLNKNTLIHKTTTIISSPSKLVKNKVFFVNIFQPGSDIYYESINLHKKTFVKTTQKHYFHNFLFSITLARKVSNNKYQERKSFHV